MPIKPENKARYPKNWKEIRASILQRANNKCEFCGIENYSVRENGSKVVLTIAHLDHTPENCNPENLRALCQKCHNTYDAEHRKETRRRQVRKKLQQEQPDDLEKDAEEYVMQTASGTAEEMETLIEAFKAGARWMAEQGNSIQCEIEWYDGPYPNFTEEQQFELCRGFKPDDKVIVQIRKAE